MSTAKTILFALAITLAAGAALIGYAWLIAAVVIRVNDHLIRRRERRPNP